MNSLRNIISAHAAQGRAVWHFNFSDFACLNAIARAAKEANIPIIAGLSEGERGFVGVKAAAALIKSFRAAGVPIYLNADHTHTLAGIKAAAEAGFDMVIFDGSRLHKNQNTERTREAVEYARLVNPNIVVEGELGYIGASSQVHDGIPEGIEKTTVDDAARFVRETGVDCFAPAVGNIHGIIKGGEPKLDIPLIRRIKQAVKIPLVLHGASGNTNTDLKAAIEAGITIIHINTELRLAWREALEKTLKKKPREAAPYALLANSEDAIYKTITKKLQIR
jgi:fructose-bisphosphate aldolase class II